MPLVTAHLTLAPLVDAHVDGLLAMFREPSVRRYLLDDELVERAWVEAEVETSAARFAAGLLGLYAAFAGEALAGFAGFRPFYDPPELQLLYGVAPAFTGRGLAREMAQAVIDVAFRERGFRAVRASTDEPNRASVRVLERLGMRQVATRPGERWPQLDFLLEHPQSSRSVT